MECMYSRSKQSDSAIVFWEMKVMVSWYQVAIHMVVTDQKAMKQHSSYVYFALLHYIMNPNAPLAQPMLIHMSMAGI